jgi:hypothetical protein
MRYERKSDENERVRVKIVTCQEREWRCDDKRKDGLRLGSQVLYASRKRRENDRKER